jgi:ABC-type nickel/cobalt efflux system permease component RcnA
MSLAITSGLLVLGALDALEPGHGKSMLVGWMGGHTTRWYHVALLAVSVMLGYLLLSGTLAYGVAHLATQLHGHNQVFRTFELVSAGLMFCLALFWVVQRFAQQKPTNLQSMANHLAHGLTCHHAHSDEKLASQTPATPWQAMSLGLLSALRPCPVKLSVLAAAIAMELQQGAMALMAFSVGAGLTMLLIALATKLTAYQGSQLTQAWAPLKRISWLQPAVLARASAVFSLTIAVLLLAKAFWFPHAELGLNFADQQAQHLSTEGLRVANAH